MGSAVSRSVAQGAEFSPDTETTPPNIDEWRSREYGRLERHAHVYLDYTGGGLYAESQLKKHQQLLQDHVCGNPHSRNPASAVSTAMMESARARVLRFFRADPNEYAAIFTQNATGALRLLGEAYPFDATGHLLLLADNHNSVNGLREYARRRGSAYSYSPIHAGDLRLDAPALERRLDETGLGGPRLFAYPAQSNFSGVQHSMNWVRRAKERGWDVLVDCAAFAPTNRLDLSEVKPDFVPLSFYKMFGYPTGVGALLVRREQLKKLERPWFSGGTISVASVSADFHWLEETEAAFEDGTVDYLSFPAIEMGLDHLDAVGIEAIHDRVHELTVDFIEALGSLRHARGAPLALLLGPRDGKERGGTVPFLLQDPDGFRFNLAEVELEAARHNISLRTGCFCNPGASEAAHGVTGERISEILRTRKPSTKEQFERALGEETGVGIGAVRVSFGVASHRKDVDDFLAFVAQRFLNQKADALGQPGQSGITVPPTSAVRPHREGSG